MSSVHLADAEEFNKSAEPSDNKYLSDNEDPIDFADPFDDEYNDLEFAKLVDGINLADDTGLSHTPLPVVVNCREKPQQIQRRVPTNPLQDVTPTTKVVSKKVSMEEKQKLLAFKPIANAVLTLRNDFE